MNIVHGTVDVRFTVHGSELAVLRRAADEHLRRFAPDTLDGEEWVYTLDVRSYAQTASASITTWEADVTARLVYRPS